MMDAVGYLSHIIDAEGLHPAPGKVEAVLKAPAQSNVKELPSFLGLVNYYRKFIPSLYLLFDIPCITCWQVEHRGAEKMNKELRSLKQRNF